MGCTAKEVIKKTLRKANLTKDVAKRPEKHDTRRYVKCFGQLTVGCSHISSHSVNKSCKRSETNRTANTKLTLFTRNAALAIVGSDWVVPLFIL